MENVRDVLIKSTGVVTREYGSFRYGEQIKGIPIPIPLKYSRLYQFISSAKESSDPKYEQAIKRLVDLLFVNDFVIEPKRENQDALDYLLRNDGLLSFLDTQNKYFLIGSKNQLLPRYFLK